GLRIAQEYQRAVVFRLGRFHSVRGPGLYYNIPLLEWQRIVDMRTITVNVEPQETITKDSVTIKVNAVLWYRVTEPFKAILEVAARHVAESPFGLELRRMQMISEVGAEQNSTTIIMMPSEFVTVAKGLSTYLGGNHAPVRPDATATCVQNDPRGLGGIQ